MQYRGIHLLTGKGGGVGFYISDQISYERRDELEPEMIECTWIEVLCKNTKNFLICL